MQTSVRRRPTEHSTEQRRTICSARLMILVVDDNSPICRGLMHLLQISGMEATCASNAREALGILEREKPRVLVLDNQMPEMTGIELLRIIRGNAELQSMSVVMFSGDPDPRIKAEADRLGASAYYVKGKPNLDEMGKTIRALDVRAA